MHRSQFSAAFFGLATTLLTAAPALAQDGDGAPIDESNDGTGVLLEAEFVTGIEPDAQEIAGESEGSASVGELEWSVDATNEIITMNNRDLRGLDESTRQDVIDTDDRQTFGHTDISAGLNWRPVEELEFDTLVRFDVNWKEDQLGRMAGSGGTVGLYGMAFTWHAVDTERFGWSMTFGRQPFEIGGVPNDYVLAGTLDAITTTFDFRGAGALRVLAFDLFGSHDLPQSGYQYYEDGQESLFGLRGETNTMRSGAIYELVERVAGPGELTAKAYGFWASIGGGSIDETGADITYGGSLGNYRDADYAWVAGARAGYGLPIGEDGEVYVFGEFARSGGIDRKIAEWRDVDLGGMAGGAGATADIPVGGNVRIGLGADFYSFEGAQYASDGLEFDRGFVGMKGDRIGGLTLGTLSSWRPSAHVDARGVRHTPHDLSRSAGTQSIHWNLQLDVADTQFRVDHWMLSDTSATFFDRFDTLDEVQPPTGVSRDEFAAQKRAGLGIGQAFDFDLSHEIAELLRIHATGGIFLPGDYYGVEVDRIVGLDEGQTALGGDAMFWAFRLGADFSF